MKKRMVLFPLLFAIFPFMAFLRTAGADNVRGVQIVMLIATGMCLGVGLVQLFTRFGARPGA
jgi:hypothetical protein